MLLPFPSPSILQPLIEQHPPQYPAVPPSQCPRKGRSSPTPLIFATVRIFSTNHQSQAVCPHTLGMGRHPRQPQGRDFPPGTLTGPPGSPTPTPSGQRAKGVCVPCGLQEAPATRAPALGLKGSAGSPHPAPPAGRCHRG